MAAAEKPTTTTVSTKGQVILPKAVRLALGWDAGTRLVVESADGRIVLKPLASFSRTRPDDVYGLLRHQGTPKSLAEMDAGILDEAKRSHARG